MLNLKDKKGFIIIEILCALSIFIMLLGGALIVGKNSSKIKCEYAEREKYIKFLQGIKNETMYNFSYEDLKKLKNENKLYINKDKIECDFYKNKDIKILFTSINPKNKPYLEMRINGEDVFKVNLILNYEERKEKKKIECEFYKGRYKR
ncbi:type II secretion system protein [Clostridium tepidum]|uniref:type II secretion system protein n=1 Tax=Clostridium tepidum TaxID=1962263 RepID=UPI0018AA2B63|nr:type II secretion system protein [Clostridium tepidum]